MASTFLHPVAFRSYARCRTIERMAQAYLKEWRKHRHLTQGQVVGRLLEFDDPQLPATAASLSRLENGKQPYGQRILEALADIYQCEPDHLIGRNPAMEGDVIDLWQRMNDVQRERAKAVLEVLAKEAS